MMHFCKQMNHVTHFTFFSMTKPADFTECLGDELPVGWEQVYDYQGSPYYVDHINRKSFNLGLVILDDHKH